MTELIVVVGVLTILASLILPVVNAARDKARKIACSSNLHQIHQALAMYSVDNGRQMEIYPYYVTNLYSIDGSGSNPYVGDPRIFICPADSTKATKNKNNMTVLKPGNPTDTKKEWAERDDIALRTRNCSYLYEFSGRLCQTYDVDEYGGTWQSDSPSSFCEYYLVSAEDPFFQPNPNEVDRDGLVSANGLIGYVTWQEAKFHQLAFGDIYRCGQEDSTSGGFPQPPAGFVDPIDYYWNNDIYDEDFLRGYPRTWLPILRCFWHQTIRYVDKEEFEEVLNVAVDGNIFSSAPYWERTAFKYGPKIGAD